MNETSTKSKSYALVIDEDTNTILGALLQIATFHELMLFRMCRQYGVEDKKVLAFIKEIAEKEHENDWCVDPDCKHKDKKDLERRTIAPHVCTCGYKANISAELHRDHRPEQRALSLCAGCAKIWIFNEDNMTLREPTLNEMVEIQADGSWPRVQGSQQLIIEFRKKHPYVRND